MCAQATSKPGRARTFVERGGRLCAGKPRTLSGRLQLNHVPRPCGRCPGLRRAMSAPPRVARISNAALSRLRVLVGSSGQRPAEDPQTPPRLLNHWREDLRTTRFGSRIQNNRFPHVARPVCTTPGGAPEVSFLNPWYALAPAFI